jgi:hypothetical protein
MTPTTFADRAKHGYAIGTRLLVHLHYRLADWAGTGRLDRSESMRLQRVLADVWWALYSGTTYAVRDEDTDEDTWDDADNTYSDGRTVMVQIRVEPWDESDSNREPNSFLLREGAVMEHPRGTICHVSPRKPPDDCVVDHEPQWDTFGPFGSLRKFLNPATPATDWGESVQDQLYDDEDDRGTRPYRNSPISLNKAAFSPCQFWRSASSWRIEVRPPSGPHPKRITDSVHLRRSPCRWPNP